MKVLVCNACLSTIKEGEPFWQSYYSKQIFCCASCAAVALGCTRYSDGKEEYKQIFHDKSMDVEIWDTINRNLEVTQIKKEADKIKSEEPPNYRYDLDF